MTDPADFVGAKAAFFAREGVLTYQRDEKPGLPWPGFWDLPGGAREGSETAVQCLLREVEEEFGLVLHGSCLTWRAVFPSMLWPDRPSLFFAGRLSDDQVAAIRFGDEGQGWRLINLPDWLNHPLGIPEMQRRTAIAAAALGV